MNKGRWYWNNVDEKQELRKQLIREIATSEGLSSDTISKVLYRLSILSLDPLSLYRRVKDATST